MLLLKPRPLSKRAGSSCRGNTSNINVNDSVLKFKNVTEKATLSFLFKIKIHSKKKKMCSLGHKHKGEDQQIIYICWFHFSTMSV
jgi:hypothetical protein